MMFYYQFPKLKWQMIQFVVKRKTHARVIQSTVNYNRFTITFIVIWVMICQGRIRIPIIDKCFDKFTDQ